MSAQTQISPETLPIWTAAQLLADWWSDPLDSIDVGSQALTPSGLAWRPDPTGAIALAAAARLDIKPDMLVDVAAAVDLPGLVEEHERLMVGPGRTPCPPYESMWAEETPPERGIMMGAAAGAALALYRRAGLMMRPHPGELPDHLVVEFEALAWCLEQSRELAVAQLLLKEHLARWVPRFCEAVRDAAKHPYYRSLAVLTPGWIAALADHLEAPTTDA